MVVVCAYVVQEMAAAVRGEGGVQALEQKINNMPKVTVVSLCHLYQLVSVYFCWYQLVSCVSVCLCSTDLPPPAAGAA